MAAPFRFRDLPPEMRNHIIAFAVLEPEPIELYNVSPPAITAVSRQLRVESLTVFFWENTFLVRVYSDVGYHFWWHLVAHAEETLSLDNFLNGPEGDGLPADHIETYEEMRRQTQLAGAIQLWPQVRAWLGSLPRGTVRFRRIEFAVFDDWALFTQQQPADELDCELVIPSERDAGFEICWVWCADGHSFMERFWREYLEGGFLRVLAGVMGRPQRGLASLGLSDVDTLALAFMLLVDGTPPPYELEP
jgi:hypothetical protein